MSILLLDPSRRPMLAVASLAGALLGAAAGAAPSLIASEKVLSLLWAALYAVGLAATLVVSRKGSLMRILEGAMAYTALYLGVWIAVYDALLP